MVNKNFLILLQGLYFLALADRCQPINGRNFTFFSSSFTEVVDSNLNYISRAVSSNPYSGWAFIPGATWIWNTFEQTVYELVIFRVQFFINGTPSVGILQVAVDDLLTIHINGNESGCGSVVYYIVTTCNIISFLNPGKNTAVFYAINTGGPGGLAFKIDILVD